MATDLLVMIRYAKKSILKTILHYQSEKSAALVRNFREKDLQTARCQTYYFFFLDLDLIWFLTKISNQITELKKLFKSKSNLWIFWIWFGFFKSNTLELTD